MVTLGDKAVGDIVKINENGSAVNYIIVHKGKPSSDYDDSCDGVWLLRQARYGIRAWDGTSASDCSKVYNQSDINIFLNSSYLNMFDEDIRNAIKTVRVPYTATAITDELKIFLLSGYEVGLSGPKYMMRGGAKLDYFIEGTDAEACDLRKLAYSGSDSSLAYWYLRSCHSNTNETVWYITHKGTGSNFNPYVKSGVRPAFVLPSSLLVGEDGSVSTECTKASINLKNAITSDCIVACTLKVNGSIPDDAICNYEVTNNANDSVPIWEDCTNESKAGYPYVFKNKTSENGFAFSFRVSIERGSSNVSGYISSVSGGFKC